MCVHVLVDVCIVLLCEGVRTCVSVKGAICRSLLAICRSLLSDFSDFVSEGTSGGGCSSQVRARNGERVEVEGSREG